MIVGMVMGMSMGVVMGIGVAWAWAWASIWVTRLQWRTATGVEQRAVTAVELCVEREQTLTTWARIQIMFTRVSRVSHHEDLNPLQKVVLQSHDFTCMSKNSRMYL